MPSKPSWPSTRHSLLVQVKTWSDANAWQTLVETYAPLVFRYARRKGLQSADAEDIAQEAMLRIRNFDYAPAKGRFRSWLAVTSGRLIRDHLQRENRSGRRGRGGIDPDDSKLRESLEAGSPVGSGTNSVDPEWEEAFFERIVEVALRRINREFPERQWVVYRRLTTVVPKCKPSELVSSLAAEFKLTAGAIYKIKHKINQRLKEELEFLAGDLPVPNQR